MTDKTEATADETVKTSSKKREITAAVTSTAVTVLLGLAATAAIEQIGNRVKKAIARKDDENE